MAGGAHGRTLVLALLGAGLASALLRFPFGQAASGAWFLAFAAVGLFAVALPVLVAEAALGNFRRRNVVDAFGPDAWKGLGGFLALGAIVLAALVAVLAGWAARYFVLSFSESWHDDPAREFRLLAAGPDALLATVGVIAVATAVAMRGARRGQHAIVAFTSVTAIVLFAGLALWSNTLGGSGAGRSGLFAFEPAALDGSLVSAGILAGLLPALLATGVAATLAGRGADPGMPRRTTLAALLALLGLALVTLSVAALSASQGMALAGGTRLDAFTQVPALLAAVGGWQGSMLAGFFFGAILLLALVALLALLEVPATWLRERFASWTEGRALLASGLVAYLLAVPLCFGPHLVANTGLALAWVVTPLAGMLVSVHIGWSRPEVLDGFRVGDAGHPLARFVVPLLRYVHPPVFAVLFTLGTLGFLRVVGWADGSSGLWALAP